MTSQVKSRQRVSDHGEVFTSEREVNAMLDMVNEETQRIESRFLEPACGDGNFLSVILERKLDAVSASYRRNADEWMKYAFLAVSSLYGVELLPDNVAECRRRLASIVEEAAKDAHVKVDDRYLGVIRFVLGKNILCGDALTLLDEIGDPITFCEWSFVRGDRVKRRDFQLSELLDGSNRQLDIFQTDWEYDADIDALIPCPIKEYPLRDYKEVIVDG